MLSAKDLPKIELARFWTNELRRPIVVVSNQCGIGRGYFDEKAYADLTRWMCERFEAERAPIARVYHCPHYPLDGIGEYRRDHPWRKPNPGMLLQAVADLRLDPARCAILGDKMSDMEAAPPPVSVCGFSSDRAMRSRTRRRPRTKWSLILRKRSPSCDLTLSRLRLTTYEQYRCEPLATRIEGNLADQGQAEFSAIQIARSRSDVD